MTTEALEAAKKEAVWAIQKWSGKMTAEELADAIFSSPSFSDLVKDRSALSHGEPVAWQWRSRIKGGAWDAWERGRYNGEVPPFMDVEERPLYATPPATDKGEQLSAYIGQLKNALIGLQCGDTKAKVADILRTIINNMESGL